MKLKEMMEKLDTFTDEEREKYIRPLFDTFTILSQGTMSEFQQSWDKSKSYDEYKTEQNKIIRYCVEMELSLVGVAARIELKLPELGEDTEIGG